MSNGPSPALAGLFDPIMQRWMAEHAVPRAGVSLMRNNRLVFSSAYGGRRPDERVPVWSLSKAVTALCIANLITEGKLGLNDTIGRYLEPAFARFGRPADGELPRITVAQLLSHRSGIPRAIDDNLFAPGLVQLLRERPPHAATVEMLMPQILQLHLVRAPGSDFEYTNMGYVLLGQIIEALSGQSYEEACGERVLAAAGIAGPTLDPDWGGIMQAASGWAFSGPEYLALTRLLRVRPPTLFSPEVVEFLRNPEGKWMSSERTAAYTLGVIIRPGAEAEPTFLHSGGHNWNQSDAAGGPIDEARGTSFLFAGDDIAWFASYDGLSAGTNPQATAALDREFAALCNETVSWPDEDGFDRLGIGPVLA